jgi:hypothetical protein
MMTGLQVVLLLVGLVSSVVTAYRIGRQHAQTHLQAWHSTLPVSSFLTGVTLVFLWLYMG